VRITLDLLSQKRTQYREVLHKRGIQVREGVINWGSDAELRYNLTPKKKNIGELKKFRQTGRGPRQDSQILVGWGSRPNGKENGCFRARRGELKTLITFLCIHTGKEGVN